MNTNESFACPICGSLKAINMLELNCGNFDGSLLYQTVKLNACLLCGHLYNRLSPNDIINLMQYYDAEYAPTNLGATIKKGDNQKLYNKYALERYDQLYDALSNLTNTDARVLDIGCGMGGFLDYLGAKGIKNLSGIDPSNNYIDYARQKSNYTIKLGCAESIPFDNRQFDLLVMDQVLEHLAEPGKAFQEAKRVLVDGGLFYIGVPDASRYDKTYFFDFFWFLIREHIQHFDLEHLLILAEMHGFELVCSIKSDTPLMSEKMMMPNLSVIFRLNGKKKTPQKCFRLAKEIETYVANELERLYRKKAAIQQKLMESQRPVYAWGIGREFLYLYASAGLNKCAIAGLIDANPFKRNNCVVDGKRITDQTILSKARPNSVLIITAIAHADAIRSELDMLHYSGELSDLLQHNKE